jgi:hypothetical protein
MNDRRQVAADVAGCLLWAALVALILITW